MRLKARAIGPPRTLSALPYGSLKMILNKNIGFNLQIILIAIEF